MKMLTRPIRLVSAFLIATVAVALPIVFSTDAGAATVPAGVLRLHELSSGGDYFRFDPTSGSSVTQTLTQSRCVMSSSGGPLASLSASNASGPQEVGLILHGIGVKTSAEGRIGKCGEVNPPDQVLSLKIPTTGPLAGMYFDYAEIDIETNNKAIIDLALYNGTTQVDANPSTPAVDDLILNCFANPMPSACGPKSTNADGLGIVAFHIRVPSGTGTALFNEVRIKSGSSTASASVELDGGDSPCFPGGLGCSLTTNKNDSVFHVVSVSNEAPVASNVKINGAANVGNQLNGTYDYTDADADQQGTSTFSWAVNGVVQPETGQTYVVKSGDAGKPITFTVTPVAATGTSPGLPVTSASVTGNSPPVASNVKIAGTPAVGNVLTGTYDYSDVDSDAQGGSTFAWFRGSDTTPIETDQTYTPTAADAGQTLTFQVTPGAQTGTTPGTPASASIDVFETSVGCDPNAPPVDVGAASVTNLDAGSQGCQPAVFTATFADGQFNIDKPQDVPVSLEVKVDAWDPEPAQYPVLDPTQVKGPPPDTYHDGQWCVGMPASPDPLGPGNTLTPPGTEVWCLVSQHIANYGPDGQGGQLIQVTEVWLLEGDAALCRKSSCN